MKVLTRGPNGLVAEPERQRKNRSLGEPSEKCTRKNSNVPWTRGELLPWTGTDALSPQPTPARTEAMADAAIARTLFTMRV